MAEVLPSLHPATLSSEMQADVICPLFPILQKAMTESAPPLCLPQRLATPIIREHFKVQAVPFPQMLLQKIGLLSLVSLDADGWLVKARE